MAERRQSRARVHLEQLVQSVNEYISESDKLMGIPPCHERGELQSELMNNLEAAKNLAETYGLGTTRAKKHARAKSGIRGIYDH